MPCAGLFHFRTHPFREETKKTMKYEATTHGICVQVQPEFRDEESSPDRGLYLWSYHVVITNRSLDTVQLLSRYWKITDGTGQTHEVSGEGVIGQTPRLIPGDAFSYTSGVPLPTPSGFMQGRYILRSDDGKTVLAEIPAFSLDSPHHTISIN